MLDCKNRYIRLTQARVARAAKVAQDLGFTVEITGSMLRIFDRRSSASLLFRSDHIVLEQLGVDACERRRRYGSKMLDLVIAIADRAELRLELIAEPPVRPTKADLRQSDLQAWYCRRKFTNDDELLMTRLPDSGVSRLSSLHAA
jgi:hypothetical protein